ncbi:MAG: hypothetical protein ABJX82_18650, partial [Paracoccaceae bacterium]
MVRKKKNAEKKPPPEPDPTAVVQTTEEVDFEPSDEEVESTSPATNNKRDAPSSPHADQESSPRSSS